MHVLDGLIAPVERTSQHDDENRALAVKKVREALNEHRCRGGRVDACRNVAAHHRDLARIRVALEALDLPGTLELLPLADAALAWDRRRRGKE